MAYENGKSYWFLSYGGSGRALSVYGNSQVSQNRNVILWDKQVIDDQSWYVGTYPISGFFRIRTDLDQRYGLNVWRGADNYYNCDICMITGNEEDSKLDFITVNGNENLYRVKLLKEDMYLTAMGTGNGADVRWKALTRNDDQLWKLVEFTGSTPDPDPDPGNEGGGQGPYGDYVYPTVSRACSGGYTSKHPALDIRDTSSDHNIYAFADGIVAYSQNSSGQWMPGTPEGNAMEGTLASMGNCIAINHNNPITTKNHAYARTIYMHMKNNPSLHAGDTVKKGQMIGTIGTTGLSSGNHLHFSLSTGDQATLAPGQNGWIGISRLPDFDPRQVLPEYYMG